MSNLFVVCQKRHTGLIAAILLLHQEINPNESWWNDLMYAPPTTLSPSAQSSTATKSVGGKSKVGKLIKAGKGSQAARGMKGTSSGSSKAGSSNHFPLQSGLISDVETSGKSSEKEALAHVSLFAVLIEKFGTNKLTAEVFRATLRLLLHASHSVRQTLIAVFKKAHLEHDDFGQRAVNALFYLMTNSTATSKVVSSMASQGAAAGSNFAASLWSQALVFFFFALFACYFFGVLLPALNLLGCPE